MPKSPPQPGINLSVTDLVRTRQEAVAAAPPTVEKQIPIDDILPSPFQPPGRRNPSGTEIEQLARDIRDRKQLNAILLRPLGDNKFELMGGERRWRAFQHNYEHALPGEKAQWSTIRALVREATDAEASDLVAAENLQREALTPLDEAYTYAQQMGIHNFTSPKQLADHMHLDTRKVQRLLQLHKAPEFIREAMTKGLLVAEGDNAAGAKVHRRLEQEGALAFLRLHAHFLKDRQAGLAGDVEVAQREVDGATEALHAAPADLQSKEAAQRRLKKAQEALERAQARCTKDTEKRAAARTEAGIERALRENWSVRKIESFYRAAIGEHASGATAPAAGAKKRAAAATREPSEGSTDASLFTDDGVTLVVRRDLVEAATPEERGQLETVLANLTFTLVGLQLGDAAKSPQKQASTLTPSDPPNVVPHDPARDPAPGGIGGSGAGSPLRTSTATTNAS